MRVLSCCLIVLVCLSSSGYCAFKRTTLFAAAEDGNVDDVTRLLKLSRTEVTEQNDLGNTASHIAATNGHLSVVELLLLNGAEVDILNKRGSTPLHAAANYGFADIVEFLIRNKARINALGLNDNTPLHNAAKNGHENVTKILIYYGANLGAKNSNNETPSDVADKNKHKSITNLISVAKEEKDEVEKKCKASKTLIKKCIEKELMDIATNGDDKRRLYRFIRDYEINPNFKDSDGIPLLSYAALSGHRDIAEGLLISGANVDTLDRDKNTPLHIAAIQGHTKVADLLIRRGANIDAMDNSKVKPLFYAAAEGHWEVVYLLLLNGADANHQNTKGETALHVATEKSHIETIKVLLQSNAHRHLKNKNGESAMDLAKKDWVWMFQQIRSPAQDACAQYSQLDFQKEVHIRGRRAADAEAATSFEFPWMAAVYHDVNMKAERFEPVFTCGGTIISDEFVLTAAHCVENNSKMFVRVGTEFIYDKYHSGQDYAVKELIRPNYRVKLEKGDFIENKHDVTLLRLDRKIQFSNTVKPACLQTERHREIECNETMVVTGWGTMENNKLPNRLLKTDLITMPNSDCSRYLDEIKSSEYQLCAYDPEFKNDACSGDSGGPLQTFRAGSFVSTVVGVVSYGLAPCPSMAPDVFSKVAFYLDWIQSHVWPEQTAMKKIEDKNFNNFDSGEHTLTLMTWDGKDFQRNFVVKTNGRYVE